MHPVPLRRTAARLVLLGLVLLAIPLIAQASHPSPLPDDITTPNQNYHVHYTDNTPSPPGTDLNYMPQAQAQNMANALDNSNAASTGNPNGYHAGYVNLGFGAPDFNGAERQVQVFDCGAHGGCDSGNAPADRINMPATGYKTQSEACLRLVLGHELFHHAQYSYITFNKWSIWGGVPVEGTARLMQDKIYTDLDGGAGCITYPGEANNYLGNPNQTMWNISYTSALFWNYMMEQLGTLNTEPNIGVDFIRRFWENAQANNATPDTVGTIRQTITQFAPGRTLEDVFHDFSIANYAKNLNTSALPNAARYRYRDENDGTGSTYQVVNKTWTGNIPPTKGPQADSVVAWGAKYYEATVSPDCTILGFKSTGDTAAYGLIASTGSGTPVAQRLGKSVTGNFARAYINRPGNRYTKLGASVAGLSNPANFTYTFACGGARLQIVRPTSAYKAYVGEPSQPDQFLAIVNVYGPTELGEPSVEGLDVSDFQAWVGTEDPANVAPILSGSYVQGSYWLVIQAPTKPGEGDFPLLIKLGALSADTKTDAVRYAKLVRNQEIVIDASGSMSAPAGNPKIDAAKNAARLFVDAAPNSDKLGVAWFSGDGVEPNDDAVVLHTLQDVNGQRAAAKGAINTLTTHNLTSIGDGLKKGQNELDAHGSPLGQDYIVLLSDGMDNEADFWSTVRPTIVGAGTTVFSIALGPEADQALMQNIASSTGGDYLYVDLSGASPAPPAAAGAAPDAAAALANRLADAFNFANEAIRRNQRIWEQRGAIGGGATQSLTIPINEDGLTDAVFSVNWATPASVQVRLFRPDNSQVSAGGGVLILSDNTHAVFQLPQIDMAGDWRLEVKNGSGGDLPYTAAFSAKGYKGVKMQLFFGQTPADPLGTTLDKVFLKGMPMPVIAVLTSINGPVLGADVLAEIERPDGTMDTLPLMDDGNHGDGVAGDGIYANLYTRTDLASTFGVDDRSSAPGTRGSYNVMVTAKGKSDTGEFTRIKHGSFQVYELNREQGNPDGDQDGMPDRWETQFPCLSAKLNDAKVDADGDGLANFEEFKLGTDPCNPDTDKGGERDGSEGRRGANPLDPRDDRAVKLIDVEVLHDGFDHLPDPPVKPNQNTIRYPLLKACALIRVERAEIDPAGGRTPFKTIDEFDPAKYGGLYPDDNGLTPGLTYVYRLTCIGPNGELGDPSNEFTGTPREDPIPPNGTVIIAGGRPFVTSPLVKVQLLSDEDTVAMLVSNRSDFSDAQWMPYKEMIDWQLSPDANGYAIVFARFRDKAGNVSTVAFDDVRLRSGRLLGSIRGRAILIGLARPAGADAPAATNEGVYVGVAGQSDIPPAFTDANGNFELPGVPPGNYTLRYEMTGFASQTVKVSVQEGTTTEAPPVQLMEGKKTYLPLMRR
jgi:hypothetical protein